LFEELRKGKSLYASCLKVGISSSEFYDILASDEKLYEEYLLALSDYADLCMDEIRRIVQSLKDGDIDNSSAKLLIETEKWLAQKASPEPFGGKINNDFEEGECREIVVKFI
jgi:hypothetical protein